ncbi:uncharacterized protein LOC144859935 [Branchiostoma floridae x Branchiostoma japonicum]
MVQTQAEQPQSTPVHQGSSHGRVRHGNGEEKPQEEQEAGKYTSADGTYPGKARGRRDRCSFLAAGIAVVLSLVAVGFAPLTFMNKEEISQLSTNVDALKRDQDDIRQLPTTVDALKDGQDDMSTTVDALKRDQDNISATVDALMRDQNNISTTVDALKRDRDNMSTTVNTTVDDLKRDQEVMSTAVDALKRDLTKERSRITVLEQRLHEISTPLTSCPEGYAEFREICYKAFDTERTYSGAAWACRRDGGTLAIPRDATINDFLISLNNSVTDQPFYPFWMGLHDRGEEGRFEWVDGSMLGMYTNWAPGQPDNGGDQDCVVYSTHAPWKNKWNDANCDLQSRFICQAVLRTS